MPRKRKPRWPIGLHCEIEVDGRDVYLPTPAEIRAACLEFQNGWTRKEERQRAGGLVEVDFSDWYEREKLPRMTRPVVRVQTGRVHGLRGVSSWQG